MQIDAATFAVRLKCLLPKGWFANNAPILGAVLGAFSDPWAWLSQTLTYVASQTRIETASDGWLDLIGVDFFGDSLRRRSGEADEIYRTRIKSSILMDAGTRQSLIDGVGRLTGSIVQVFEPFNCFDTGGYGGTDAPSGGGGGSFAYGSTGGWGSLELPYQVFITIVTGPQEGEPMPIGYGGSRGGYSAGSLVYTSLSQTPGSLTDDDIRQIVKRLLPVNCVAWLRFV
jgi:hypothetical protein